MAVLEPAEIWECELCGREFHTKEACAVHEETCTGKRRSSHNKDLWIDSTLVFLLFILIFVFLIVVILIWGIVGGSHAESSIIKCDLGTDNLCWFWHNNYADQVAQRFVNNFGNP